MAVLILGALEEEIAFFLKEIAEHHEEEWNGYIIHFGTLFGKEVVLTYSRVGKVFSAIITQHLLDRYSFEYVLFTGVAGSLQQGLRPGDVVLASDLVHHDMDASGLGFEKGEIPYSKYRFFATDKKLLRHALQATIEEYKVIPGRIATGDQFIKAKESLSEFDASCVDMEGASVAQVCTINAVPFLVIRVISDHADGQAQEDFIMNLPLFAKHSHRVVKHILEHVDINAIETVEELKTTIRTVPHFPKEGVMFRDITTLLANKSALSFAIQDLADHFKEQKPDAVAGVEARGFILGAAIAKELGIGFIPLRKEGKLPAETEQETYELEYGEDTIEVHKDAISEGMRILLIDDLIATGGSISAAVKLIRKCGGTVLGCGFVIDLTELGGSTLLRNEGIPYYAQVRFQGE